MHYFESHKKQVQKSTSYQDINLLLDELSFGIQKILATNLKGLYLFGSLVYGDFREGTSDIDLVAIVNKPLNQNELEQAKKFHQEFGIKHPKWKERIECSYIPLQMLSSILPPIQARPYYGGGIFYGDADYGNEWIINNYLLFNQSIPLAGPMFSSLVESVDTIEVQKACIRDLFKEWEPKIEDLEWLENSHYQSYLILNLCRILYTVFLSKTASKVTSAQWVKNNYIQWKQLIEVAEQWEYGKIIQFKKEAICFIRFIVDEVKKTDLFKVALAPEY